METIKEKETTIDSKSLNNLYDTYNLVVGYLLREASQEI